MADKPKPPSRGAYVDPSEPIRGVRVGFDVKWTEDPTHAGQVVYRDHPTATHWETTKQQHLILRDRKNKRVGQYRAFVWREVIPGR